MASQSSFASPLYWHIRTLSTALDASNAAETVDELEHVSPRAFWPVVFHQMNKYLVHPACLCGLHARWWPVCRPSPICPLFDPNSLASRRDFVPRVHAYCPISRRCCHASAVFFGVARSFCRCLVSMATTPALMLFQSSCLNSMEQRAASLACPPRCVSWLRLNPLAHAEKHGSGPVLEISDLLSRHRLF
jgi:hypothetical protein